MMKVFTRFSSVKGLISSLMMVADKSDVNLSQFILPEFKNR